MSIPLVGNPPVQSASVSFPKPNYWLPTAEKIGRTVLPVIAMATVAFAAFPEQFYASVLPTAFFGLGLVISFLAAYVNDSTPAVFLEGSQDTEERAETEEADQEAYTAREKISEEASRNSMLNPGEIHTVPGSGLKENREALSSGKPKSSGDDSFFGMFT